MSACALPRWLIVCLTLLAAGGWSLPATAQSLTQSQPAAGQTLAGQSVMAAAACDSYADLRKQLTWLGPHIDNPALAGMMESILMLSTQGKGLAGLDVKRPLGVVVTTENDAIAVLGFVPVKDLDKLLDSLQGVTGPVQRNDGIRSVTLPSGLSFDIAESNGWAIIAQQGTLPESVEDLDPAPILEPLVANYSLALEAHPHLMPEPLRALMGLAIEQMAAASAQQGRPVDAATLKAAVAGLAGVETLSVGATLSPEENEVFLENRFVALVGPKAAGSTAKPTVATAPTADGKPATLRGQAVVPLTESQRSMLQAAFAGALPASGDRTTRMLAGLFQELLAAVTSSGAVDAAITIDTSGATGDSPEPVMTAGVAVADGAALQQKLKQQFGPGTPLPRGVTVRFDSGKVGAATLHSIGVDLTGTPAVDTLGDTLEITLAVTPKYAFILTGGDPEKRLPGLLENVGQPNAESEKNGVPGVALQMAADRMLEYAAGRGAGPQASAAALRAGQAAKENADAALVKMSIKPIERGLATRISAGAGVLEAGAAMAVPPGGPGEVGIDPAGRPVRDQPQRFPAPR